MRGVGTRIDAMRPTVVRNAIVPTAPVAMVIVDIVLHDGCVHVGDRRVVPESTAVPAAAYVSVSIVAEPVVNAAVESNDRTPVSLIPTIHTVRESPIPRRPI